jgi:hypothetical protein
VIEKMNLHRNMKTIKLLFAASVALSLHSGNLFAQQQQQFDAQQVMQQMQQRTVENYRQQLVVTNDVEWAVIRERIMKVQTLRSASTLSGGLQGLIGGLGGGMRNGGAGGGAAAGAGAGGGGANRLGALLGQQQDPNVETLQNTIDRGGTKDQIKAALAKLREGRKAKQAELDKAQESLRSVLTTRQEAILVINGILD